jgi:hypothetical protein
MGNALVGDNARKVATARGGRWRHVQVGQILDRAGGSKEFGWNEAATIERLLPVDEQALLRAYVEGGSEPADAANIYDALEVPANATPPRLAIAVARAESPPGTLSAPTGICTLTVD